jgi:hypothetical protein
MKKNNLIERAKISYDPSLLVKVCRSARKAAAKRRSLKALEEQLRELMWESQRVDPLISDNWMCIPGKDLRELREGIDALARIRERMLRFVRQRVPRRIS